MLVFASAIVGCTDDGPSSPTAQEHPLFAMMGGDCPDWFDGECEALTQAQMDKLDSIANSPDLSNGGICNGVGAFMMGLLAAGQVYRATNSLDMYNPEYDYMYGGRVNHHDSTMVIHPWALGTTWADQLGQIFTHEAGGHLFQGQDPSEMDYEERECDAIEFEKTCWSGLRNADSDPEFCDQGGTS